MSEIDKITNTDLNGRGVIGLPDTPGLTTTEMQNKLDEIAKDVLVPKVNELVENANATNTTLGTTDISGIGNGTVTGAIDTINSNLESAKHARGIYKGQDDNLDGVILVSYEELGIPTGARIDTILLSPAYSSAPNITYNLYTGQKSINGINVYGRCTINGTSTHPANYAFWYDIVYK